MNVESERHENGRWRWVPFTHPATMDTVVMDGDLKNKVKADLESFLKSKQYYHRLGRVWKRSYLLLGDSGTGKSSFIAAMAKFLNFDVYDIDITKVSDDSDLKMLLLQTTSRSIIVIEDLDRALKSVISALQNNSIVAQRLSESRSVRSRDESGEAEGGVFCRESVHTVREFRKLYGLFRMGSRRKEEHSLDLGSVDKEGSRHGA
ncbi:hypothetical protein GH714_031960 [Hevea brasiliensis]|uniref:ATPase AAA-type core domain-containing protein n=1 Tax=Hevea brasiliensis TaxID=3981 RepID=A0A6A6LDE7_HEVBR|nr:hypothetical protein GH714_031960 [Hevea brasiliensis]